MPLFLLLNLNISLKITGLKEVDMTFLTEEDNEFIYEQEETLDVIANPVEEQRHIEEENTYNQNKKISLLKSVFSRFSSLS